MNLWNAMNYQTKTKEDKKDYNSVNNLWFDMNYKNKYTDSNLSNANKRGGLWQSLNYHTYIPGDERYNKDKEGYKLPRDANGNIIYSQANTTLEKMIKNKEGELGFVPEYNNKPKRSPIDRIIDGLNIGQYAVMGALYNLTDNDPTNKWYEGAWKGIKSGNPFGEDYQEYEKSFGDVLNNLGWEKEKNPQGKWYNPLSWSPKNVARNVTSIAGDMFLDPLNYLSLGTKELVEGTGKKVGKEIIEETSEKTAKQILEEVGDTV